MFRFPRLQGLVGTHPSGESSLIDFLLCELTNFTGEGWEQEDDITLVTLEIGRTLTTPGAPGYHPRDEYIIRLAPYFVAEHGAGQQYATRDPRSIWRGMGRWHGRCTAVARRVNF
jgi:hypothetical protein